MSKVINSPPLYCLVLVCLTLLSCSPFSHVVGQGDISQVAESWKAVQETPPSSRGAAWDEDRSNTVRNDPNFSLFMAIFDNSAYEQQLYAVSGRHMFCFVANHHLLKLHPDVRVWEGLAQQRNSGTATQFMKSHHILLTNPISYAYENKKRYQKSQIGQDVYVSRRLHGWLIQPVSDSGHGIELEGWSKLAPTDMEGLPYDAQGDYWSGIPVVVNGPIHAFVRSYIQWPLADSSATKLSFLAANPTQFGIFNKFVATVQAAQPDFFSWWIKTSVPWYSVLMAPTDSAFLKVRKDMAFWNLMSQSVSNAEVLMKFLSLSHSSLPLWNTQRNTYLTRSGQLLNVVDSTVFSVKNPMKSTSTTFYDEMTQGTYGKFNWYNMKEYHDGWIMPLNDVLIPSNFYITGSVVNTGVTTFDEVLPVWMQDDRYSKMLALVNKGSFKPKILAAKTQAIAASTNHVMLWPLNDHIEAIAHIYGGYAYLLAGATDAALSSLEHFLSDHCTWATVDEGGVTSTKSLIGGKNVWTTRVPYVDNSTKTYDSADIMKFQTNTDATHIRLTFMTSAIESFISPDLSTPTDAMRDAGTYIRTYYQRAYLIPLNEILAYDDNKAFILPLPYVHADAMSYNSADPAAQNSEAKPVLETAPSSKVMMEMLGQGEILDLVVPEPPPSASSVGLAVGNP